VVLAKKTDKNPPIPVVLAKKSVYLQAECESK
jgi:hypothetical protein